MSNVLAAVDASSQAMQGLVVSLASGEAANAAAVPADGNGTLLDVMA